MYILYPWVKEAQKKNIGEYLKSTRHFVPISKIVAFDMSTFENIEENDNSNDIIEKFDEINDCFLHILFNYKEEFVNIENCFGIQWVCTLEKRSEFLVISENEYCVIVDLNQLADYLECILSIELTNSDALNNRVIPDEIVNYFAENPEMISQFCKENEIAENEFYDMMNGESDNSIMIPHLLRLLSEMLYKNGCYDGAFRYQCLLKMLLEQPRKVILNSDSTFLPDIDNCRLHFEQFKSIAIFVFSHEMQHLLIERKSKAVDIKLRKQIRTLDIFMSQKRNELNIIWKYLSRRIISRNQTMIIELEEAFSVNDYLADIFNQLKGVINEWIDVCDFMESDCLDDDDEEVYCDLKALLDLINIEGKDIYDIIFDISQVVRLLIIQETNHIQSSIIKYALGEIQEIKSKNMRRIQFIVMAVMNEYLSVRSAASNFDTKLDNYFEKYDKHSLLFLNLFKYTNEKWVESKIHDFIEEIRAVLDISHEYYYKLFIYQTLHAVQDGFITKGFKTIYSTQEEHLKLDLNALTCDTYEELIQALSNDKKYLSKVEIIKNSEDIYYFYTINS